MAEQPAPKRRGRPPKTEADRKDGHFTFRTRAGLREKLSFASEQSGRSISEEIEKRLEQSFDFSDLAQAVSAAVAMHTSDKIVQEFGGIERINYALAFAKHFKRLKQRADKEFGTDEDWRFHPEKAQMIREELREQIPMFMELCDSALEEPESLGMVIDEDPPSQASAEAANDRPEDAVAPAAKAIKPSARVRKPSS